jgi:RNA polymerase sigma factor (sigma-70 family)
MLFGNPTKPGDLCLRSLDPIELFRLCAADRENSEVWYEFLRRYTIKLKQFIGGTLRQVGGGAIGQNQSMTQGCTQESDLFQNAIVRLVENDCAAMKRFSGTCEGDLLAYLAVICRSVVLDSLRRESSIQRRHAAAAREEAITNLTYSRRFMDHSGFEREILGRELISLIRRTIKSNSGHVSDRDQLVFDLRFVDGLSFAEIARCRGINLSKSGVERVLKRLVDRVQVMAASGKPEESVQ